MVNRGEEHERLDDAAAVVDGRDHLQTIDHAIAQLESTRSALVHRLEHSEEYPDRRERPTTGGFNRNDDSSRGR
jgi:hypothetical protein